LRDKGVVVDEASLVARFKKKRWIGVSAPNRNKNGLIAFGDRAAEMLYAQPPHLEVVSPMIRGIVTDVEAGILLANKTLSMAMQVPTTSSFILKPQILLAHSLGLADVELRAAEHIWKMAGVDRVVGVVGLEAVAGFLERSQGVGPKFLLDIGGEKTECGIVTPDGVIVGNWLKHGGKDIDTALAYYCKMRYNLAVGARGAMRIKHALSEESVLIRGKDLANGLPKSILVKSIELEEAILLEKAKVVKLVLAVLEKAPSNLSETVVNNGLYLCGGGSKLHELASYLSTELKLMVNVMEEPEYALVRGLSGWL
jgi:rod shape-determining protein MreB